jgi:hypothetical protein
VNSLSSLVTQRDELQVHLLLAPSKALELVD